MAVKVWCERLDDITLGNSAYYSWHFLCRTFHHTLRGTVKNIPSNGKKNHSRSWMQQQRCYDYLCPFCRLIYLSTWVMGGKPCATVKLQRANYQVSIPSFQKKHFQIHQELEGVPFFPLTMQFSKCICLIGWSTVVILKKGNVEQHFRTVHKMKRPTSLRAKKAFVM